MTTKFAWSATSNHGLFSRPISRTAGALGGLDTQTTSYRVRQWRYSVCPAAGEATLVCAGGRQRQTRPVVAAEVSRERLISDSARRAARVVRQYTVANKLCALVTLTYSLRRYDSATSSSDLRKFIRKLQQELARTFPYCAVVEQDPKTSTFHIHLLVRPEIARLAKDRWSHGHADVSQDGQFHSLRAAAAYISKQFREQYGSGAHRYHLGRGFVPEVLTGSSDDSDEARAAAISIMGGELPQSEWDSREQSDWCGPPVIVLRWPEPAGAIALEVAAQPNSRSQPTRRGSVFQQSDRRGTSLESRHDCDLRTIRPQRLTPVGRRRRGRLLMRTRLSLTAASQPKGAANGRTT